MVNKILVVLFAIGVLLVIWNSLALLVKEASFDIKRSFGANGQSSIRKHITRYVEVIKDKAKVQSYVTNFFLISLVIFLLSLVLLIKPLGISGILMAGIVSLAPYVFLRVKVLVAQRDGSFEGEALIKEFRTAYRLSNKNIYAAIDKTVKELPSKYAFSKRALFKLSLRIKVYRDAEELSEILKDFAFAYDTEWATLLAQNIYNASYESTDISAGLDDMLEICKTINANIEKRKQNNVQSSAIALILSPLFLIGFSALLFAMFDAKEVVRMQFGSRLGIIFVILILIVFIANIVATQLVRHQKYDL